MHSVFVYGTLRQGKGNHKLLVNSNFVGKAKTVNKYEMTASGIPFVDPNKETSNIVGEVYEVNDETLDRLDMLEGYSPEDHNGSWYKRTPVKVKLEQSGEEIDTQIYFNEQKANTVIINGDFISPKIS